MKLIKDAGLENEIDDFIEVEGNFKIKKIGKYTLFIFTQFLCIYKAYQASDPNYYFNTKGKYGLDTQDDD